MYRGEDSLKLEFIYCLETRIYLQSEDFTMTILISNILQERGMEEKKGVWKNSLKKNGLFRKNNGEKKIIETGIYLLRLSKLENLYIVRIKTILF